MKNSNKTARAKGSSPRVKEFVLCGANDVRDSEVDGYAAQIDTKASKTHTRPAQTATRAGAKDKDASARALLRFIAKGRAEGKSLSETFAEYAALSRRAKGSVRNAYYELLRRGETDASFRARVQMEPGTCAAKRLTFAPSEERELLKNVLRLKKKGVSARRALLLLSDGDGRKMLRYQNKFRNLVAKNRPLVEEVVNEVRREQGYCYDPYEKQPRGADFLRLRLEREIDGLYRRLSASLREENEELQREIARLHLENAALRGKAPAGSEKTSELCEDIPALRGKAPAGRDASPVLSEGDASKEERPAPSAVLSAAGAALGAPVLPYGEILPAEPRA